MQSFVNSRALDHLCSCCSSDGRVLSFLPGCCPLNNWAGRDLVSSSANSAPGELGGCVDGMKQQPRWQEWLSSSENILMSAPVFPALLFSGAYFLALECPSNPEIFGLPPRYIGNSRFSFKG